MDDWSVVLVAAPDEQVVARGLSEDEATALVLELVEDEGPGDYHEVRRGDVTVWTSESGELVRFVPGARVV